MELCKSSERDCLAKTRGTNQPFVATRGCEYACCACILVYVCTCVCVSMCPCVCMRFCVFTLITFEIYTESDRVPAPLAVSIALPLALPSVGSHNPPPPLSTVTLPQLCMLFQNTHEDPQDAEALAEPGERIAKSPLQRILTAHIMSRWAKHEGALAHISLKRSIEMLELQCAHRFPARPADPDSSVFRRAFSCPSARTLTA